MTNVVAPRGFTPECYASGKPYNSPGNRYWKSTTANTVIAVGDPVIRIQSSDPNGYPEIQRATTGQKATGVVQSIEIVTSDLSKQGALSATDTGYVMVCDDPDVLYSVQEAGSGTALSYTNLDKHINSIAAVDGDTTTGRSKYAIDNNAVSTGNTWILRGLLQRPDNSIAGVGTTWLVQLNLDTEVNAGASNYSETA